MKTRTIWFVVFCFCIGAIASAQQPVCENGTCALVAPMSVRSAPVATVVRNTAATVHGVTHGVVQGVSHGIAQSKSDIQARAGRMYHVGGSFGRGRYEGVGFSTISADHAIRNCCYWGRRTPVEIGVARGVRGWYATVIYR